MYEVTAPIGEGGMGQVYQARDTKLNRDVALKVLPDSLAHDAERLARFTREAQTLASLNHPNIAHIHGLEESGGVRALVMELVEGEDLCQRTARGAIPLDQALLIAKQIAEALEAAHEQGIVHRDLKPANIRVRSDGTVKVLDFGLAKAVEASASGLQAPGALGQLPTITTPAMTEVGVILGTAAYMSPEQAAGAPVDRRADIWSYGVVLWEMLSGQRLFRGETVVHTLADVLRSSIDFDRLTAPAPIKHLLRRCLDRDAKTRLRDIGEARVAIARYLADPKNVSEASRPPRHAYQWLGWAMAAGLATIATVGWLRPRPAAPNAASADLAFSIALTAGSFSPVGDLHATPQISPDGAAVIFYEGTKTAAFGAGSVQVQRLNTFTPELVRTVGYRNPGFWSPDSRSFVFSDGTNLKRMRVPDGAPELIANGIATMVGGTWSDTGTLLIPTAGGGGLYTVPAAGGDPKRVDVTGLPQPQLIWWPEFLPDSDDFLFLASSLVTVEESEIYLATLRDGRGVDPVLLMKNATAVHYSPAGGGRILFVRNDNLYAQTLDRTARPPRLKGDPELIQQRVASSPSFWVAHFSVSRTGVVAWRPGTAGLSQVTVFDRQGKEVGTAGPPTIVQTLTLAPDDTRLLVGFMAATWLLEPGRPGRQRLEQTWGKQMVGGLRWSRDGSKFVGQTLTSRQELLVVERPITGEGPVRELKTLPGIFRLEDVSPDGKTLLASRGVLDTTVFSVLLDDGQKEPRPLVQTGETITHARFSPDGKSIVYTASSPGSGAGGTYAQPYPGSGLRKLVTSRGNYPVWRKDGREIVYVDDYQGRNYIWSVPVAGSGVDVRPGKATPLFPARLPATTYGDLSFLAVSRDGSRFYIPQAVEQPGSDAIHVRMGWAK